MEAQEGEDTMKNKMLILMMAVVLLFAIVLTNVQMHAIAQEAYAEWNSSTIYTNGDIVSYQAKLWQSQWWNQGQVPGTTGEWGCWKEYKGSISVTPIQTPTSTPTSKPTLKPTSKPTSKPTPIPTSAVVTNTPTPTVQGNLPVISINTERNQAVTSKENYIAATAQIQDSQTKDLVYDGNIQIRGRGNSTWMVPKKPYRIKLSKKTNLFGMGENKDWVLLANYYDQTVMRNMMAYHFGREMGFGAPDYQSVDVIMNGSYAGNYLLCENTQLGKDRVPIFDWEKAAEDIAQAIAKSNFSLSKEADSMKKALKTNLEWASSGTFTYHNTVFKIADYYDVPAITGGYLLELDDTYDEISKFKTASKQPIMFKSPEYANTNQAMMKYMQSYLQAFENAVRSSDFHTTYEGKRVHYSDLVDMDSLVDFWIITETFSNLDSMFKSTYMYKDINGKLVMGPLWDWDLCAGGSMVVEYSDYTQTWQTLYRKLSAAQGDQWYRYLIKDPVFLQKAYDRYHSIRTTLIADLLGNQGTIEQMQTYLTRSGQENLKLWPSNGIGFGFGPGTNQGMTQIPVYSDKVKELKTWLNKHITWLDRQFSGYDTLRSSLGVK
jgi:hypothetical protein